jgi:hypothetical protein
MLRVLAVLALAVTSASAAPSAAGWEVTPPPGWTLDTAASDALVASTKAGFFDNGRGVDVDGQIYRAPADPEHAKLLVQVIHTAGDFATPEELVELWVARAGTTTSVTRRREDGSSIADLWLVATPHPVHMIIHARRDDGLLHMLVAACSEPAGGSERRLAGATPKNRSDCGPALASVRVADDRKRGGGWIQWIAIAGAVLMCVALIGWRRDASKRGPVR